MTIEKHFVINPHETMLLDPVGIVRQTPDYQSDVHSIEPPWSAPTHTIIKSFSLFTQNIQTP